MMGKENITTPQKRYFDKMMETYTVMVCQVITDYQTRKFGISTPIVFKKGLLRKFGLSADLARKIVEGQVTDISTMILALDAMENILFLYDPAVKLQGRIAQLKKRNYFYKRYVINMDFEKPIFQRNRVYDK